MTNEIRTFDSGATRDTAEGKLNYVRILSPIALRRYVQYMTKHAKQSDGSMREPDNWKTGFPKDVYLDSLGRHLVAVWLLQQGFTETDNHGPVILEDSLCGIIFNAFGWLHEILKEKPVEFVCPVEWVIKEIRRCGWFVHNSDSKKFLWKNLTLHFSTTGYICFMKEHKRHPGYGEAPGYWPTKEAAEDALKQYLGKNNG